MSAKLIDLSDNNAPPDFRAVAKAGYVGVWLKVTEGLGYVDPTFPDRARAARAAGLRVGGYHFLHPTESGEAQAVLFAKHLGTIYPNDLRPALDYESAEAGDAQARAFNRETVKLTHVGPLFYSYSAFIAQLDLSTPIGYGLWLADYGPDNGAEHEAQTPHPWKRTLAHQYTSKGEVPGCPGRTDITVAADLRPLLAHPPPRV